MILIELNAADDSIVKSYVYANGQILMQQSGLPSNRYFYLHDRLGSVRQIINTSGNVVKYYTYNPFGETLESSGTLDNPYLFAGQYYDSEIAEYYLRARQYDPHIGRFTTRDPVFGQFEEPLTLHRYLYCGNEPVNRIDLTGLWSTLIHNQIINEAFFPGLEVTYIADVSAGSAWVDWPWRQTASCAYMHAMTNAKTNQSVEAAQEQMLGFVWENYRLYRQYEELGNEHKAYNYLGRAMHPIMDWTCPAHNWQPWELDREHYFSHNDPTTIDERTLKDTVSMMRYMMEQLDVDYELSLMLAY